jgi:UPF0755 protein
MKRNLKILVSLAAVSTALLLVYLYVIFYLPASADPTLRVVSVPKGTSFRVVASELKKAGLIRDFDRFLLAARLKNAYKNTKAGEYEFSASMPPVEILGMLIEGKVKLHPLTIPEGYNIREIAAALEKAGLADKDEFIRTANDRGLAASLGLPGKSLEGFLFPDTYIFTRGMTVQEIVTKMTDRFKSVYTLEFDSIARKKGMELDKVITLASIIEKETGAGEERGLISAVFHNRLKKRIRLQSDPTVIYGIEDFDGNLTKKHLKTRTPYNTYMKYGLPPGPIANPGRAAIEAAINPEKEDYLYFVSRNDGTHYFSRSLREHNNAVNVYQKRAGQKRTGQSTRR